jgi:DnaJ-class molecular chaperone
MTDYYEILQIEKTATQDIIKQSYKKLAKIHHPDKGGDKEMFQKIQVAYETLSDEQKRQEYDNPMPDIFGGGFPMGGGGFPMGGGGIFSTGGGGFPMGGGGFPFDFIFKNGNNKKKVDTKYALKIKLSDVYFGLKKTLNVKHDIKCENCNKKCDVCKGACKVKKVLNMGMMQIIQEQPCTSCNGYGIIKDDKNCDNCENKGVKVKKNIIQIIVPKGVENGKQIVFEGLGEQPVNDNEVAGDFIVIIQIEDNNYFKREGLHLVYEKDITFKESVIGKEILIPHFENEIRINTQTFGVINPNKKYVIYNKGIKNETGNQGNLYIKFNIQYDEKILSEEQIKALTEIL